MRYTFLFLILLLFTTLKGQDILDSAASFYYKNWLLEHREYDEYLRQLTSLTAHYPDYEPLKHDLIAYYKIQNQWDSALHYFNVYFPEKKDYPQTITVKRLHLLAINHKPEQMNSVIDDHTITSDYKTLFRLSSLILVKEWKSSLALYDSLAPGFSEVQKFAPVLNEIRQPYKSPALALSLSAIIPGAGKIYSGRIKDGISSFLLVGLFSWQAYTGFHKKGTASVFGWINGGFALGFYLSNIYGGYQSAKWHNKHKDENIYDQLYFYHKCAMP